MVAHPHEINMVRETRAHASLYRNISEDHLCVEVSIRQQLGSWIKKTIYILDTQLLNRTAISSTKKSGVIIYYVRNHSFAPARLPMHRQLHSNLSVRGLDVECTYNESSAACDLSQHHFLKSIL